jgi:WD40 repeat protein
MAPFVIALRSDTAYLCDIRLSGGGKSQNSQKDDFPKKETGAVVSAAATPGGSAADGGKLAAKLGSWRPLGEGHRAAPAFAVVIDAETDIDPLLPTVVAASQREVIRWSAVAAPVSLVGSGGDRYNEVWNVSNADLRGARVGGIAASVGALALALSDGTVQIRSLADGTLTETLAGHATGVPVHACIFLPGADAARDTVLTASADETLRLWTASQRSSGSGPGSGSSAGTTTRDSLVLEGTGHTRAVSALSPAGGGRLVSCSPDGRVCVWDRATAAELGAFDGGSTPFVDCAARGDLVIAVQPTRLVILRIVADDRAQKGRDGVRLDLVAGIPIPTTENTFSSVAISPAAADGIVANVDGASGDAAQQARHVVIGTADGSTFLADIEALIRESVGALMSIGVRGHSAPVTAAHFVTIHRESLGPRAGVGAGAAGDANIDCVLTASHDGHLKLWDAASGLVLSDEVLSTVSPPEPINHFSIEGGADANWAAVLGTRTVVWGTTQGGAQARTQVWLCGSRERKQLLTAASAAQKMRSSAVHDDALAPAGRAGGAGGGARRRRAGDAAGFVSAVAVSASHKRIVAAIGNQVHILRAAKDLPLEMVIRPDSRAAVVSVSCSVLAHGDAIVFGTADRKLCVWDVAANKQAHALVGHAAPVVSIDASGDGHLFVSSSQDRSIRLWEQAFDENKEWERTPHADPIVVICVSPDARLAVTIDLAGVTSLWDAATCKLIHVSSALRGPARAIAASFRADGQQVAIMGLRSVHLWDVSHSSSKSSSSSSSSGPHDEKGSAVPPVRAFPVHAHAGRVLAVGHVAPAVLATVGSDGYIATWDAASPASVEAIACVSVTSHDGALRRAGARIVSLASSTAIAPVGTNDGRGGGRGSANKADGGQDGDCNSDCDSDSDSDSDADGAGDTHGAHSSSSAMHVLSACIAGVNVAILHRDGAVRLWTVSDVGIARCTVVVHDATSRLRGRVDAMVISPRGGTVCLTSSDSRATAVVETATGRLRGVLTSFAAGSSSGSSLTAIASSATGALVAGITDGSCAVSLARVVFSDGGGAPLGFVSIGETPGIPPVSHGGAAGSLATGTAGTGASSGTTHGTGVNQYTVPGLGTVPAGESPCMVHSVCVSAESDFVFAATIGRVTCFAIADHRVVSATHYVISNDPYAEPPLLAAGPLGSNLVFAYCAADSMCYRLTAVGLRAGRFRVLVLFGLVWFCLVLFCFVLFCFVLFCFVFVCFQITTGSSVYSIFFFILAQRRLAPGWVDARPVCVGD